MSEGEEEQQSGAVVSALTKLVGLGLLVLCLWLALRFVTRWFKWLALGVLVGVIYYFVASRRRKDDEEGSDAS